jgi:hypothetical protein
VEEQPMPRPQKGSGSYQCRDEQVVDGLVVTQQACVIAQVKRAAFSNL